MTAGNKRQPIICRTRKRTRTWRPDRVEEIVIRAHHEFVMLWSRIASHVVTGVVVKMHALQVRNVAVAIRQHHAERSVVHDETVEINRREWKYRFDAVRRAQVVVQDVMTHDAFTTTRVAHRADAGQIKLADELGSEGRAAGRVERLQDVEMLLKQLRSCEGAEIKYLI